jgi:hypothetical protein
MDNLEDLGSDDDLVYLLTLLIQKLRPKIVPGSVYEILTEMLVLFEMENLTKDDIKEFAKLIRQTEYERETFH